MRRLLFITHRITSYNVCYTKLLRTISSTSPVCGVMLMYLKLPAKCVIISVIRGDESLIPNGFTELRANDFIFTVSSQKDQQKLKDYFIK